MTNLNITIGNGTETNSHYVGRPGKGKHSNLGNPFKPEAKTKEAYQKAINQYRKWLWAKLNSTQKEDFPIKAELMSILVETIEFDDGVSLFCPGFCTQQGLPCHAEVIKGCVEWLATECNS